jgi:hypothetical protein
MTAAGCIAEYQPDDDEDGLSDACEIQLASNFVPEMSFYDYDQVERETRWFGQPTAGGGVRLGFLIGYYYDVGNSEASRSNCQSALVLPPIDFIDWIFGGGVSSCLGHMGDSEFVILDLAWDSRSKHWVLTDAWLSAHTSERHFGPAQHYGYPTQLTYPNKVGGYPLIWVADGKHANYESEYECDTGAFLGADDCKAERNEVRLNVMVNSGNIGSHFEHLIDGATCMNANHPAILYGSGCGTEYYFTDEEFRGWYSGTGVASRSYAEIVDEWMPVYFAGLP